jgi:hypothetical protein
MENILDLKEIQIGKMIEMRWKEMNISMERTCNFLALHDEQILEMFCKDGIDSYYLLKWSKLLEYDFFRLYSQHLILYSPPAAIGKKEKMESKLPKFRKNIYTKGLINFILELIENKQKTIQQIIHEYNIPKTTLYKWINKYENSNF